jgi:hypothetical protein
VPPSCHQIMVPDGIELVDPRPSLIATHLAESAFLPARPGQLATVAGITR